MARNKFAHDMDVLLDQLQTSTDAETMSQLLPVCERLIELNKKRLVKINHSIMQVICAKHLIEQGYSVMIEHPLLGGQLMADLFAVRQKELEIEYDIESVLISERLGLAEDMEALVVEIETGYVPPKAALYPVKYRETRMAAKIARYCRYSHRFGMATPNYHVLQIPRILMLPPEQKNQKKLERLKEKCDVFYQNPPILLDSLVMSEVDSIYIINVDHVTITQISPEKYLDAILRAEGIIFD
ncbi:MAG: hypothetical protein KAQ65_03645 [Candidatus Thorarchaeota archaeon]|nr:hypothetical protein [Candidatus Thorarchaeota archaeon]